MSRFILIATVVALVVLLSVQPAIAHPGHGTFLMQNLAKMTLSPTLMVGGMGIALVAGAGHALTPGHGKTMVAAYLVGSRGTPQQALFLGLITTLTHTISIFALGIVALLFSQYVLPEQLYPLLSLLSGLMVCGVGFWLLEQYVDNSTRHHHDHTNHGSKSQVTAQSLLALGIAGGLVPCPSALVLLLSAIALHQIAYGLLLVTAFSLGLAIVLVAIGLAVVYTHNWVSKLPSMQLLQHYAPLVSAIAVILAGGILTACAVM